MWRLRPQNRMLNDLFDAVSSRADVKGRRKPGYGVMDSFKSLFNRSFFEIYVLNFRFQEEPFLKLFVTSWIPELARLWYTSVTIRLRSLLVNVLRTSSIDPEIVRWGSKMIGHIAEEQNCT